MYDKSLVYDLDIKWVCITKQHIGKIYLCWKKVNKNLNVEVTQYFYSHIHFQFNLVIYLISSLNLTLNVTELLIIYIPFYNENFTIVSVKIEKIVLK